MGHGKSKQVELAKTSQSLLHVARVDDVEPGRDHHRQDDVQQLMEMRMIDNYWRSQPDFYLYNILLGNTIDGVTTSVFYSGVISGGVYLMTHMISSVIIVKPVLQLELFYGDYTKLTNSQFYRMAPAFYGLSILLMLMNLVYVPKTVVDISFMLLTVVMTTFHPMNYCPEDAATCYDVRQMGALNATCVRTYLGMKCEGRDGILRYISAYRTWDLTENALGLGNWQIFIFVLMAWAAILICVYSGMRFMGNFMTALFILNIIMEIIMFLMSSMERGGLKCLPEIISLELDTIDWRSVFLAVAFTTSKLGLIRPTGHMTSAAYLLKATFNIEITTIIIIALQFVLHIWRMIGIYSVAGVLSDAMGVGCYAVLPHGAPLFAAIFNEFIMYRDAPYLICTLYNLFHWLLEIAKLAITLHMYLMNINDFVPRLNTFKAYVIPVLALISVVISLIYASVYFLDQLIPVLNFCQTHVEQIFLLAVQSFLLFYIYGIHRISDDVHYMTGSRPVRLVIVLWAVYPIMIIICLVQIIFAKIDDDFIHDDPTSYEFTLTIRLVLIFIDVVILVLFSFLYSANHLCKKMLPFIELVKPQFHFGPPSTISRIGRKHFQPNVGTRAQIMRRRIIKYRKDAIRALHRVDELGLQKHARIFLEKDTHFLIPSTGTTNVYTFRTRLVTRYKPLYK